MKPGDKVWFISKFGDRVTGTYEGPSERVEGKHIVVSHNAFGVEDEQPTRCIVTLECLHREEAA